MASGWEQYLMEERESLDVALLWALEAQKIQDTDKIRNQIARIQKHITPS